MQIRLVIYIRHLTSDIRHFIMDLIEAMGHVGSLLSSITFIPQVYKVWKTKSANDLSMTMMLIVFTSTVVWLIYGVGKNLTPVIVCNGIICAMSILLIYFKLSFKKTSEL